MRLLEAMLMRSISVVLGYLSRLSLQNLIELLKLRILSSLFSVILAACFKNSVFGFHFICRVCTLHDIREFCWS